VDRPIAQAIWEAKEKKKAGQQAEQGGQKQLPAPTGDAAPPGDAPPAPPAPQSPQPRPSGSAPRRAPGCG
jgi:hypothetical protein